MTEHPRLQAQHGGASGRDLWGLSEPSAHDHPNVTDNGSEARGGQSLAVSTRCKEHPTPRHPSASRVCQMRSVGSGSQASPPPCPVLGPADVARQKDAGFCVREVPAARQLSCIPLPTSAPRTVLQRAGTPINPTFPNWKPQGGNTAAKGRDRLGPGFHPLQEGTGHRVRFVGLLRELNGLSGCHALRSAPGLS